MKKYHPDMIGSRGEAINSRAPMLQSKGRHQGIAHGGVPIVANLLDRLSFAETINAAVPIFKVRRG